MKVLVSFFLHSFFISVSFCQDETVLHCAAKPGCQINVQCDSVPVGWSRPGFNINQHLQAKEFPITCKSDSKGKDSFNWLPLISRNVIDIKNINSGLDQLKNEVNDYKNQMSAGQIAKQKPRDSREFDEIRKKTNEQAAAIKNLNKENAAQSAQIKDLQEDQKNTKQEMTELKEVNKEMLKALEDMNAKLVSMGKPPQKLPTRSGQVVVPTTKTQVTSKYDPKSTNCKLKIGSICYFTSKLQFNFEFSYKDAVEFCKKYNGSVVLITDKTSYEKTMHFVRQEMSLVGAVHIDVWTRNRFDPTVGDVTPADSYMKWYPRYPDVGNSYKFSTFIKIFIRQNGNSKEQGMRNTPERYESTAAAVCERQDNS